MSFQCDGRNYTRRIREVKPTCLIFLNIPKYSSGTSPWGTPTAGNFGNQRIDDRLIEVVALTANQLVGCFHKEFICVNCSGYLFYNVVLNSLVIFQKSLVSFFSINFEMIKKKILTLQAFLILENCKFFFKTSTFPPKLFCLKHTTFKHFFF